ncbi:hypothetical protein EUGRSUZ_A01451 [Eucalyptus grandis]|uniref:Uncharacterized protein n=2 Tax=Eucalyptus grandis TaxID=71139 RepID=A0ACC3M4F5_EUCGR|nr:hypothetical protein EUGRSUZ_A01451 [Eucalyptus grandis]
MGSNKGIILEKIKNETVDLNQNRIRIQGSGSGSIPLKAALLGRGRLLPRPFPFPLESILRWTFRMISWTLDYDLASGIQFCYYLFIYFLCSLECLGTVFLLWRLTYVGGANSGRSG